MPKDPDWISPEKLDEHLNLAIAEAGRLRGTIAPLANSLLGLTRGYVENGWIRAAVWAALNAGHALARSGVKNYFAETGRRGAEATNKKRKPKVPPARELELAIKRMIRTKEAKNETDAKEKLAAKLKISSRAIYNRLSQQKQGPK